MNAADLPGSRRRMAGTGDDRPSDDDSQRQLDAMSVLPGPGARASSRPAAIASTLPAPVRNQVAANCRRVPSSPRCKLCAAPFGGLGGLVFGPAGYALPPEIQPCAQIASASFASRG